MRQSVLFKASSNCNVSPRHFSKNETDNLVSLQKCLLHLASPDTLDYRAECIVQLILTVNVVQLLMHFFLPDERLSFESRETL